MDSNTNKRTIQFTSQGFRSQEVEIAPDIPMQTVSKRYSLIKQEDTYLDSNLNDLDVGTRARNRNFQDRLDEIWRSSAVFEAKLRTEVKEASETILNMRDDYKLHIERNLMNLKTEINSIFDKIDNEVLVSEDKRVDVIEENVHIFTKQIVPATIEKQSGEVSRNLRRAYETFDIEKKKEFKREKKLVEKASNHLQNTAQRFEDENALMSSCFFNLEDDITNHEVHAARMHLLKNAAAIDRIVSLNDISTKEKATREEEDLDVLDTLIETQELLQQTILMHFGTAAEREEEPPRTDRLNRRVAQAANRRMSKNTPTHSTHDSGHNSSSNSVQSRNPSRSQSPSTSLLEAHPSPPKGVSTIVPPAVASVKKTAKK
mmetsp:Transcript_34360/g.49955  ORF Transcript_34360/g.49955 Transcript_34360/m.49955 type:complete len:374 (-) Transcript_34360:1980-3101(-)